MTNTEFLRGRIMAKVLTTPIGDKTETLQDLCRSEWSLEFERLMRNRLLVGRYRYGKMGSKPGYDNIGSALWHLRAYLETGNMEHLVDVANLCLVEFVHCEHPKGHFEAMDDSEHAQNVQQ